MRARGFLGYLSLCLVAGAVTAGMVWSADTASPPAQGKGEVFPVTCGKRPLRSCKEVVPPLVELIRTMVGDHIKAMYDGKQINLLATSAQDRYRADVQMNVPVCNLATGEVTQNQKNGAGQPGESCGKNCQYACKQDATTKQVSCDLDMASCEAQRAWVRGALVELVRFKLAEVAGELEVKHALNVSARCAVPPEEQGAKTVLSDLSGALADWATLNKGKPASCGLSDVSDDEVPGAQGQGPVAATDDKKGPEQAACFLGMARTSLEKVAGGIAVCEVFYRADTAWAGGESQVFDQLIPVAASKAQDQCKETAKKGTAAEYQTCLNGALPGQARTLFASTMISYAVDKSALGVAPSGPQTVVAQPAVGGRAPASATVSFGQTTGGSGQ